MRKLAFILSTLIVSCAEPRQHPIKIEGFVKLKNDSLVPAIWFTDTFQLANDSTLFYYNSNGSKAIIHPPYTIYRIDK
jgi:hypothetical protein